MVRQVLGGRNAPRWVGAILVFLGGGLSQDADAARWVEVGNGSLPTDRVLVDTDSIEKTDDIVTVDIATLYASPRTNAHNITMDRHVQRTAFKCAERSFVPIGTTGFLGDRRVGAGAQTADWRLHFAPLPDKPMSNRIFALVCGPSAAGGTAPPEAKPKMSSGSGFVVDDAGDILTNAHVVNHCKSIAAKALNSPPVPVSVDALDPKNDLAIVRPARGPSLGEPLHFRNASQPETLGESIGVIGYPLAGILSSEPKATFGQINSVAGINNDYTLLQISAPVQPGNSGGPVLDSSGLVVGIVVSQASLKMTAIAGNVPQNINFAIRSEIAQVFLTAHGIKPVTNRRWRTRTTEEIAAIGQRSTVFLACVLE